MTDTRAPTPAPATIKRGTPAAKRRAEVPPRARAKVVAGKASADRAISMLPIPRRLVVRALEWGAGALILAALGTAAWAFGVPQAAGTATGEALGRAGLTVRHIEVTGLKRMERGPVYDVALSERERALPLVDLTGIRQRLLGFGWIKDARVSRRLPDTLVIDVVERVPAAVWQHDGELALVDPTGTLIAPVADTGLPALPLLIGPDANRMVDEYRLLLEAAPRLKPMIVSATWVGGRRWDLTFQGGEVVALPEGRGAAYAALEQFAKDDLAFQYLGHHYPRIDMRLGDRTVVRVTREPGKTVEPAPKPAAPGPQTT